MDSGAQRRQSILVIGGGIAGIQAALDSADLGFHVYLVEKTPSIGGHMAMNDKTFPTNDCAMCSMAPKMVEVFRHPNIELMTYSEVIGVQGKVGQFRVKLLKKPRYVDEKTCIGCGNCSQVCPVEVPSEFNLGLGTRKAIYVPFPQAVPNVYTIDMKNCQQCFLCMFECESNSINFDQEPEEIDVEVGAIIVATGFKVFDPNEGREELGYSIYKNVLTSIELERILSPSGPTGGELLRPSDHTKPKKIGFALCVGSRDAQVGNLYCSRVCCMYSLKHAILVSEKIPDANCFVFFIDIRPYGKGCERYYNRAKAEPGVQFIRSRVAEVLEKDDGSLILRYEDTLMGEIKELEVDLLVLASAIQPNKSHKELANILGIKLDEYGFFKVNDVSNPVLTSKPGVFVCGTAQGPLDIPDSIVQASSAAAETSALLSDVRLKTEKKQVEEIGLMPVPRIGVFICRCGGNISNVVDVELATEYVKSLPYVVHASNHVFACSNDVQAKIKETIKEKKLNRVVVAACTPRTHESLFRGTCAEVGLNPYLFEFANIREQCSWVHAKYPTVATGKAKDIIRMAVAKAKLLEPQKGQEIQIEPACLVVGGGISGLSASLLVSRQGFKTYLVERENRLGGMINDLYTIFPGDMSPHDLLDPMMRAVANQENIEVMLSTNIVDISGYLGNFNVNVIQDGNSMFFKVGTIIIATGMQEFKQKGLYKYGENSRVCTLLELEDLLCKRKLIDGETIVMILCAGSRKENNFTYCSRICCMAAIKNVKIIKEQYPNSKVYVCYRDIMMTGKGYEELYASAQKVFGVQFFRYAEKNDPQVLNIGNKLVVRVFDTLTKMTFDIPSDRIVLATPLIPNEGTDFLSHLLKIPKGEDGFFLEAHIKLRPLDFASDGIYLCGAAHSPKDIVGSLAQALGAAARATIPLVKGRFTTEGIIAEVNSDLCSGCGICQKSCEFNAIMFEEKPKGKKIAKVVEALCKGCGACGAVCLSGAITMHHFKDNQIEAMIKASFVE